MEGKKKIIDIILEISFYVLLHISFEDEKNRIKSQLILNLDMIDNTRMACFSFDKANQITYGSQSI